MTEQPENAPSKLLRGRELFARNAWADAHDALSQADQDEPLALGDLWRLGWSAELCGRGTVGLAVLERIYQQELERAPVMAARAAFWLGFRLLNMGEASRGSGWLARAERVLDKLGAECVERGYLGLPRIRQQFFSGDFAEALVSASRALQIAERFGDADLASFARNLQGKCLLRLGQLEAGLKLHDEAMLAVTTGELSPMITGLVYCLAIDSCQSVHEVRRVREWTASLKHWCDAQPQLSPFTGECMVCRAEVMELGGEWSLALEEARRATQNLLEAYGPHATGTAIYRQAEVHRLRGELAVAEERYREASQVGRDPQPGLSLLRLAQGKGDVAVQALSRALTAATEPLARAKLLPAYVETLVATSALEEASAAADELADIARQFPSDALAGHSTKARGAVELARGDARAALGWLRQSFEVWRDLDAPYLAGQTRMQLACAYQAVGDEEGALLEIAAARAIFERLGAAPDMAAIDALKAADAPAHATGLSVRELEVLRLVATGRTNKLIARELCLSEKTIDRHVSNILAKLNVPSRAAATAFAYENKLI